MRCKVIGVRDHQCDDDTELIVAGDVPLVDTAGEITGYTPTVVDADSPDEAEQLALTQAGTTES